MTKLIIFSHAQSKKLEISVRKLLRTVKKINDKMKNMMLK
jgi:hypothetical protein